MKKNSNYNFIVIFKNISLFRKSFSTPKRKTYYRENFYPSRSQSRSQSNNPNHSRSYSRDSPQHGRRSRSHSRNSYEHKKEVTVHLIIKNKIATVVFLLVMILIKKLLL